jgi:hypothetical protein
MEAALVFLRTKDDFERNLILYLAQKVYDQRVILDKNLAAYIAENVGKLFKA